MVRLGVWSWLMGIAHVGGRVLCPHIQDGDVAFLVDTSRKGWRQRLLNPDRTHCRGSKRRKVLAAGAPRTGADGALADFLGTFLDHARVDDAAFFGGVVAADGGERGASFYDGPGGAAAFGARARSVLGVAESFSGAVLSLFAHEVLDAYPEALVLATATNGTRWIDAATAADARAGDGKTRAALFGSKDASPYLAAKRYAEFYGALLRRVPCCQLLVLDLAGGAAAAELDRAASYLRRRGIKGKGGA